MELIIATVVAVAILALIDLAALGWGADTRDNVDRAPGNSLGFRTR